MFTDRVLVALAVLGFGTLGLCLLGIAYQIVIMSRQVAEVSAMVQALLKMH